MLLSFNADVFWSAFSAIATTFTAIVAILISILSITLSNKAKLKIEWNWHPRLYNSKPDLKHKIKSLDDFIDRYKMALDINITLINVGKMPLDIYQYGLFLHNHGKDNLDYFFACIDECPPTLPLKLNVGNSYSFSITSSDYKQLIKKLKKAKFYTKFYARTSNGVYFSHKMKPFKIKDKEKQSIVLVGKNNKTGINKSVK